MKIFCRKFSLVTVPEFYDERGHWPWEVGSLGNNQGIIPASLIQTSLSPLFGEEQRRVLVNCVVETES